MKPVAVLALQGAFLEHQQMLHRLGVESCQIRNLDDWQNYLENYAPNYIGASLILPGGESTTMMRIMRDEGLVAPLQDAIKSGMPVLGTCAGLILLDADHLDTMRISVKRNAYGHQLGSFRTHSMVSGIGPVPMTFIRAPYIEQVGAGVEVLATVDGHIVAARQGNQLVTAFHPELDDDVRLHTSFLKLGEQN